MSLFNSQAKHRQEGFAPNHNNNNADSPASPPHPHPAAMTAAANNMFFGHHLLHTPHAPHSGDFSDELAAMMASNTAHHNKTPAEHPIHNPFDTNGPPELQYPPVGRHPPPHNMFDVSSHPFSVPTSRLRDVPHDSPFDGSFVGSPDAGAFRPRSRSRSKGPHGGRVAATRKHRGSFSSASPIARPGSPPRPQAILIPPHTHAHGGHGHHAPISPLYAQTAPTWFVPPNDSPFSLPTPESYGGGGVFGSAPTAGMMGESPKSLVSKDSPPPPGASDPVAKQAALANEKRRRRRESHNAVERRRRDNINERISELATLIPECLLDPGTTASGASPDIAEALSPDASTFAEAGAAGADAGPVKANKGMILRKSVEYIRYLQQLVNAQATRNRELEAQLGRFALDGEGVDVDAGGELRLVGDDGKEGSAEVMDVEHDDRGRNREPVRVKKESEDSPSDKGMDD